MIIMVIVVLVVIEKQSMVDNNSYYIQMENGMRKTKIKIHLFQIIWAK